MRMDDQRRRVRIALSGVELPQGMSIKAGSRVRVMLVGEVIGYERGEKGTKTSNEELGVMKQDRPAHIEVQYSSIRIASVGEDNRSVEELESDMKGKPMQGMDTDGDEY